MLTRDGGRCRGIGVAVLGVALLLSGCSGDDGSNEGTVTVDVSDAPSGPDGAGSSTGVGGDGPSSSDEPSDPVPEPSEHPKPERPAAMDDTGEKGAIAAAEYFFELYNYVQATGDTEGLIEIVDSDCSACSSLIERIAEIYDQGGHMVGGAVALEEIVAEPTLDGLAWEVSYDMVVDGMRVFSKDGASESYDPSRYSNARLGAQHLDGSWRVLEIYSGKS